MWEARFEAMEAEDEEEEDDDDDDEDEDEDEEGEGEEGEEGGEEAEEGEGEGEGEEEVEEPEDPRLVPDDYTAGPDAALDHDRFFMHGEELKAKYNEIELDSFMKLLNVNPQVQWQDVHGHHYKAGMHAYEDESQNLDPYFHLIAEVERKHFERTEAHKFRLGSEIKIMGDDPRKRPVFSRT